jgi:hypothetical protein
MNTAVKEETSIAVAMERIEKLASPYGEIEKKYPQTVSEFKLIQQKQYDTFLKKLNDYGPYNVTLGREIKDNKSILTSLCVIAIRCTEKTQRLINLLFDKHKAANEPVIDSFDDISIYGIIAQIIHNNKWGK